MKWVTRENANVDRIACPWLIKKFIDPEAEFLFVQRDEVLYVAEHEGANSYDAPDARYTHRDGKCSFDVLIEDFDLAADAGLVRLAKIVHAADVDEESTRRRKVTGYLRSRTDSRCCIGLRTTRRSSSKRLCMTPCTRGASNKRGEPRLTVVLE